MKLQKETFYFIAASTGCSCCSNENFLFGPIANEAEAKEVKQSFITCRRLASQYAPSGHYHIFTKECEILPSSMDAESRDIIRSEDRYICGNIIITGFNNNVPNCKDEWDLG